MGDDWWYYGDRCQYKDSTRNTIIIAVASSLSVLAVMLVIAVVSVICVKNKYKKRPKKDAMVMPNMAAHWRQ